MSKLRILGIIFLTVGFLAGLTILILEILKPRTAGLRVETNPASEVYLGGKFLGTTPLDTILKPAEISLKLIPKDGLLQPYITKINLLDGVKTVVRRNFGDSEGESSGDIDYFDKNPDDQASIIVISVPDSAQVTIDNKKVGLTPYKNSSLASGVHEIKVVKEGYLERKLKVQIYRGYQLTSIVKLAALKQETPTLGPTPFATEPGSPAI
ncbi:PEGA domain-containing protein [Candidatus Woesebacteria bacterium]|nr:PEGA domain-containing protein [Candidatus Woesebacteria bacterium]